MSDSCHIDELGKRLNTANIHTLLYVTKNTLGLYIIQVIIYKVKIIEKVFACQYLPFSPKMPKKIIYYTKEGKMQEIETDIEGYPNYGLTNYGRVINRRTGKFMVLTPNTQGELSVGLVRDHHQVRYSVKCLVARGFVPGETELFNTPILLDRDLTNLRADNIVWRPRWFAWRYKRQFDISPPWYTSFRVMDIVNQIEYNSIEHAAMTEGLLCVDILMSIYNEVTVFPTGQLFTHIS